MSSTTRTLAALVAGLAIGAALRAFGSPGAIAAAQHLSPLGELWLNALRMTLVPLIFALVVSGVGTLTTLGQGGRTIATALGLFAGLLALSAGSGVLLMSLALKIWPLPVGAFSALLHAPVGGGPATPTIVEQFVGLIPTNPVAAAASGAMSPLVIFALLFGLALAQVAEGPRRAVQAVVKGIGETMMVLVDWVLKASPVGIFVLALGMALNTGLQAAGALAQTAIMTTAMPVAGIGIAYLLARVLGGVGFGRFAKAALGPQAVAVGTTSSMACLPAMIEAAEAGFDCPPPLAGSVLPLAVSTFRFGNVILISGTALFAAHAAGLHPGPLQIAVMCLVVILTNIGVVGLPAAAVLYAAEAPGFQAIGAPLEMLPLLIAMAAIPDIADTVCNVTSDLAATTIVRRWIAEPRLAGRAAAPAA